MNKKEIEEITELLRNSNMSMDDIAAQYHKSRSTISSLNLGKTYKRDIKYPIRRAGAFTNNQMAFILKYKDEYKPKSMQLILNCSTLDTIRSYYYKSSDYEAPEYIEDPVLEARRTVIDFLFNNTALLFHKFGDERLELEDVIWIKFLARCGVPFENVMWGNTDNINFELHKCSYENNIPLLKTKSDVHTYLEWDGQKSTVAREMQMYYYNKWPQYNFQPVDYTMFDCQLLRKWLSQEQLEILESFKSFKE